MIRIKLLEKPALWVALVVTLPLAPWLAVSYDSQWFVDDFIRINANARRILDQTFPWPTADISKEFAAAAHDHIGENAAVSTPLLSLWQNAGMMQPSATHIPSAMNAGLCPELADEVLPYVDAAWNEIRPLLLRGQIWALNAEVYGGSLAALDKYGIPMRHFIALWNGNYAVLADARYSLALADRRGPESETVISGIADLTSLWRSTLLPAYSVATIRLQSSAMSLIEYAIARGFDPASIANALGSEWERCRAIRQATLLQRRDYSLHYSTDDNGEPLETYRKVDRAFDLIGNAKSGIALCDAIDAQDSSAIAWIRQALVDRGHDSFSGFDDPLLSWTLLPGEFGRFRAYVRTHQPSLRRRLGVPQLYDGVSPDAAELEAYAIAPFGFSLETFSPAAREWATAFVALACQRFRNDTGSWPLNIQQLAPKYLHPEFAKQAARTSASYVNTLKTSQNLANEPLVPPLELVQLELTPQHLTKWLQIHRGNWNAYAPGFGNSIAWNCKELTGSAQTSGTKKFAVEGAVNCVTMREPLLALSAVSFLRRIAGDSCTTSSAWAIPRGERQPSVSMSLDDRMYTSLNEGLPAVPASAIEITREYAWSQLLGSNGNAGALSETTIDEMLKRASPRFHLELASRLVPHEQPIAWCRIQAEIEVPATVLAVTLKLPENRAGDPGAAQNATFANRMEVWNTLIVEPISSGRKAIP